MVVRTNVMAINAYRQLGMNNSAVGKSLEKLSSGFRINRAGDDASGLAISEKMKAQIKGLDTAVANAQDGISLIQTAEGSLIEVHDMLNRMVELCGKAANGTMDDSVDRPALQEEITALKDEINRIAQGTNFNGIELLDGSLAGGAKITQTPATAAGTSVEVRGGWTFDMNSIATHLAGASLGSDSDAVSVLGVEITDDPSGAGLTGDGTADEWKALITSALNGGTATIDGNTYDISVSGDNITLTQSGPISADQAHEATGLDAETVLSYSSSTDVNGSALSIVATGTDSVQGGVATAGAAGKTTLDFTGKTGADVLGSTVKIGDRTYEFYDSAAGAYAGSNTGIAITGTDNAAAIATALAAGTAPTGITVDNADVASGQVSYSDSSDPTADAPAVSMSGGGLTLQVGDTAANYNQITVAINDMSCEGLGIADIDISTQVGAKEALNLLKNKGVGSTSDGGLVGTEGCGAINVVSTQRAKLGALQNRLEHTINNLQVTSENMTAANSRIRDTDMAKEMMNYTKMNVLSQAAQAMLAQANMQPQSVLQLLQ